ncbi:MAG TPA: hypothetical protein VK506_12545, partial [Conexibacter sp.]|nr:hypothetical protein [Conexibacter sp.]
MARPGTNGVRQTTARIPSSRAGGVHHEAAARRAGPQREPLRVEVNTRPYERERGREVVRLAAHVEQLARLALARAEAARVELQRRHAGGRERLAPSRVAVQLAHARRRVQED